MNSKVDSYIADGCGRCAYYATPKCKVKNWQEALETLRQLVLECGLSEELKWGVPCYTVEGKNIVIVCAFKNYCSLSFFKGALLDDVHHILQKPGESTQSGRIIKFTAPAEILERWDMLKAYILQAVAVEKSGLKVASQPLPEPLPDELLQKFEAVPALEKAFFSLTPGRQRGYVLHFSQPQQSKSRASRIEKCMEKIMRGEGLNDKGRSGFL